MGWYNNYEVRVNYHIDWDDNIVKNVLKEYNCNWLYLRDMEMPIIIFSVYSQHNIEDILILLEKLYGVEFNFNLYERLKID